MLEQFSENIVLHFPRTNGAVDDMIDRLMDTVGGIRQPEIVREMIIAALKAGQESNDKAALKMMNSTLKEMRYTAKVFEPYRLCGKVTVFGSARTTPEEMPYQMARTFGQKIVEAGYMVITGGGGGIMQAVNEGAGAAKSFGINIRLPFEQKSNPVVNGGPRDITYKYFFNRKVAFLKEAHAVALFPGGFGTMDEAMEVLALLQTGKLYPLPMILLDVPGGTYWRDWLHFLRCKLLPLRYIDQNDLLLMQKVSTVEEAVCRINHFYRNYHSLRYVGEKLVLRLKSEISDDLLELLKQQYSDILTAHGTIQQKRCLPEEWEDPELAHMPRLVIDFNRRNFGRLRSLIDTINDFSK